MFKVIKIKGTDYYLVTDVDRDPDYGTSIDYWFMPTEEFLDNTGAYDRLVLFSSFDRAEIHLKSDAVIDAATRSFNNPELIIVDLVDMDIVNKALEDELLT